MKSPTFCFADEPTSALDWTNGQQVVKLLEAAAHQDGAVVLIVSHDARLIPFADRVFHLEDGRMITQKQKSEVRKSVHSDPSPNGYAKERTFDDESELAELPI
jgi:putative ABC transport system ATP-binding protein